MHRIDTDTAQQDKFGAGKNGFTGGNPQTGELPTALDEDFFDALQEEISRVIEAAGITLDKSEYGQLLQAMGQLYAPLNGLNNKQDKSDNLTAFSELTGAADRLPYFTAAKTLALTALTSAGRSLISQANANGMLTYLGLNGGISASATGRLIGVRTMSESGVYTPTSGTSFVVVETIGGGGGSSFVSAQSSSSRASSGGGGGGAYALSLFTSGFSGVTVTIGAGGTAPASGGASSFGSLVTCPGGSSGVLASFTSSQTGFASPGGGGALPTGSYVYASPGSLGGFGWSLSNSQAGGNGGASGKGGAGPSGAGNGSAGIAAVCPGAGGSGGAVAPGGTAVNGASGASGMVIVWEYK